MPWFDDAIEYVAKCAIEYAVALGWRDAASILLNADLRLEDVHEPWADHDPLTEEVYQPREKRDPLVAAYLGFPAVAFIPIRKRLNDPDDSLHNEIHEALSSALEPGLLGQSPEAQLITTEPTGGWRHDMARFLGGEESPTNQARVSSAVREPPFQWNGLKFQSKTETRIAQALSEADVLFFPLPGAVAGVQKKEPDFLVCTDGKWGILEVQGDEFHPPETAAKEHERARWFKKYGVKVVEIYSATRCYSDPDEVVAEFLKQLRSG